MNSEENFVIAIHGGAQNKDRNTFTPEMEEAYKKGIEEALLTGWEVLNDDGPALDAVEAAVRVLEDNPLFNAGRGSAINCEKDTEQDAAIMDGKTLKAGSVAAIRFVKNPVSLARKVMETTEHVMLTGPGAEEFARRSGLELRPSEYFITQEKLEEFKNTLNHEKHTAGKGTVGAVALDKKGDLAAATSTGGLTNKLKGRVGDSPIIGAGTYANNEACAVSCTGDGEFIIRGVFAHLVYALIKFKNMSLHEALREVFRINGEGLKTEMGIIAVDRKADAELFYNTLPMYRGYRRNQEPAFLAIWEDEFRIE
ncbi:MAG: isoaspartyl peptidase/L-asparaginase [Ignavibacteria bacterium]|jgi:beta-aspartyl-peptidase (threonine type)|nr:isoaspartyl peptidase/L-asparaginase [Ignavibacteria bacterium]MCU7504487.1 isoaspartyl peptidase/L-asparaginase [Ignavibacteria bacterium]MCU7517934.1 isoaspartyl peptidase/L-asparaginase [Ignavibacteria bacterium]